MVLLVNYFKQRSKQTPQRTLHNSELLEQRVG